MHAIKRIHLTYFARFVIPLARRGDVGKSEIVRTLNTRDKAEAIARRPGKLAEIAATVDADLRRRGLPPLAGAYETPWHVEAAKDRQTRLRASDERDTDDHGNELGSPRSDVEEDILERAKEIEQTHGRHIARAYHRTAMGDGEPIKAAADRWHADCRASGNREQTIGNNTRALFEFARFLAQRDPSLTADAALSTVALPAVSRRIAGEFVEWLRGPDGGNLSDKTTANRVSSLSALWRWADRKGLIEQDRSPWADQTAGLKTKHKPEGEDERPFRDDELVRLLRADPLTWRKTGYAVGLRDVLRLSLLTGARPNELCMLQRRDVIYDGTGFRIRRETTKSDAGVRSIPLHPIIAGIITRRLEAAEADQDATLFPDLTPGGPDGKRSWHLSKYFTGWRRHVLGGDDTVDLYSARRCFARFFTLAGAEGVHECSVEVREHLFGHKPATLSGQVYTGRDLGWGLYVRAINGMVSRGISAEVRLALEETMGRLHLTDCRHPDPVPTLGR